MLHNETSTLYLKWKLKEATRFQIIDVIENSYFFFRDLIRTYWIRKKRIGFLKRFTEVILCDIVINCIKMLFNAEIVIT